MKLLDILKTSSTALRRNKMRSILTMLGIVIGIMAVILIMSLGAGAEGFIINQVQGVGVNNIFIEPGAMNKDGPPDQMRGIDLTTLKYKDVEVVKRASLIDLVSGMVVGKERIIYKNNNRDATFYGIDASYFEIMNIDLAEGRPFTEAEVKSKAQAVVLGDKVREDLFEEEDALGKKVKIDQKSFEVIGVLEKIGTVAFQNQDELFFIPVTTGQKNILGIDYLIAIAAQARSEDLVAEAEDEIQWLLRDEHNIDNPEGEISKDDFHTGTQEQAQDMLSQIMGVLSILLSSIAAISLVVGGIGIMNIMLVSVTERTREIGLRKAVGATNSNILTQFLLESTMLTILGGIGGIILAAGFSYLASVIIKSLGYEDWVFSLPAISIILAVGVSACVGLLFGLYPARRAAKLDPIEALRYE